MSYRDFVFRIPEPPEGTPIGYEHVGWSCQTYHIGGRLYAYPECKQCYPCWRKIKKD